LVTFRNSTTFPSRVGSGAVTPVAGALLILAPIRKEASREPVKEPIDSVSERADDEQDEDDVL
jgi:hypothetical protein